MASIYPRKDSPFLWIKYKKAGKKVSEPTNFRKGHPPDERKAKLLCAEKSLEEMKVGRTPKKGAWLSWVPDFLNVKYRRSQRTYDAYRARWDNLNRFLEENGIPSPANFERDHCFKFLAWRQETDGVEHNTALHEIKLLSLLMHEAFLRGYTPSNPCVRLGVKKDKPEKKPEMTDLEIATIRDALRNPKKYFDDHSHWLSEEDRGWMIVAFEIAIYQGARLRECSVPRSRIDFEKQTINFHAKGDKDHLTRLHDKLIPFLKDLFKDGRERACDIPPKTVKTPSKIWWRFFRKLKMRHLCFHCTRVTVETRLYRANIQEWRIRRYMGHSQNKDSDAHLVYIRLTPEDLDVCVQALSYNLSLQSPGGSSSSSKPRSSQSFRGTLEAQPSRLD